MADDQAWAIGAEQGAQAGRDRREHKRSRQEQLQDEQRNQKLGVYTDLFHNDRISPAELAHAVEDVYHDAEPEKKMTILGRIFNHKKAKQQAADAAKGSQTRATEEQGIIAGAKSPADVATAQAQGESQADTAKKRAAIQALPALFPEATPEQLSEMKERILSPGAIHRPTADENKREDYRAAVQGGYKGSFEKWVAEQSAGGRAAGAPAKPPSPAATYANLTAKKILADKKQGPPLTDEESAQLEGAKGALTVAGVERANAFARAAAENNLVVTTDENGQDVLTQRSQAVAASKVGKPMAAGVIGAPTAHDKETQQYAVSSLNRLREMKQIVKKHPEIFGPVGGRTTKASVWLGTQSPDAQKFLQDSQFLAEHSTAVFGGRASGTVEALHKIQSDPSTNPEALLAGFESDEATLNDFTTAQGRLPAPRKATVASESKGKPKKGDTKKNSAGDTIMYDGTKWSLKSAAAASH